MSFSGGHHHHFPIGPKAVFPFRVNDLVDVFFSISSPQAWRPGVVKQVSADGQCQVDCKGKTIWVPVCGDEIRLRKMSLT